MATEKTTAGARLSAVRETVGAARVALNNALIERNAAIVSAQEDGWATTGIAAALGVSESTVTKVLKTAEVAK